MLTWSRLAKPGVNTSVRFCFAFLKVNDCQRDLFIDTDYALKKNGGVRHPAVGLFGANLVPIHTE